MAQCTRCDRPATWRARLGLGADGATTQRLLCDRHATEATFSEVLRLVALVRLRPAATESVTIADDRQLVTSDDRPLQRRLGRDAATA